MRRRPVRSSCDLVCVAREILGRMQSPASRTPAGTFTVRNSQSITRSVYLLNYPLDGPAHHGSHHDVLEAVPYTGVRPHTSERIRGPANGRLRCIMKVLMLVHRPHLDVRATIVPFSTLVARSPDFGQSVAWSDRAPSFCCRPASALAHLLLPAGLRSPADASAWRLGQRCALRRKPLWTTLHAA